MRILAHSVAATVVLGAALTAFPQNALAESAPSPSARAAAAAACESGYVCAWEDAGYKGSRYVHRKAATGRWEIDGWDGDNEISSIINNSGCGAFFYRYDAWKELPYVYAAHTSKSSLSGDPNNDFESYEIVC